MGLGHGTRSLRLFEFIVLALVASRQFASQ